MWRHPTRRREIQSFHFASDYQVGGSDAIAKIGCVCLRAREKQIIPSCSRHVACSNQAMLSTIISLPFSCRHELESVLPDNFLCECDKEKPSLAGELTLSVVAFVSRRGNATLKRARGLDRLPFRKMGCAAWRSSASRRTPALSTSLRRQASLSLNFAVLPILVQAVSTQPVDRKLSNAATDAITMHHTAFLESILPSASSSRNRSTHQDRRNDWQ